MSAWFPNNYKSFLWACLRLVFVLLHIIKQLTRGFQGLSCNPQNPRPPSRGRDWQRTKISAQGWVVFRYMSTLQLHHTASCRGFYHDTWVWQRMIHDSFASYFFFQSLTYFLLPSSRSFLKLFDLLLCWNNALQQVPGLLRKKRGIYNKIQRSWINYPDPFWTYSHPHHSSKLCLSLWLHTYTLTPA